MVSFAKFKCEDPPSLGARLGLGIPQTVDWHSCRRSSKLVCDGVEP
jgi:hypothetical protein